MKKLLRKRFDKLKSDAQIKNRVRSFGTKKNPDIDIIR